MATIETAYYVPTFLGLSTTLGISCTVSVLCILAFEICRRLDSMQCLFSPRTKLINNAISKLPNTVFSWISAILKYNEKDFLDKVGLDATMHIRFLRMTIQFLLLLSISVCPILLAIHWNCGSSMDSVDLADELAALSKNESTLITAIEDTISNFTVTKLLNQSTSDIDHFRSNSTLHYLSIANISNRSNIVWVHVFFVFFISLLWLWLIFVNHLHHNELLKKHQKKTISALNQRSILITHIPHHLRNQSSLRKYFETLRLGTIDSVMLVSSTGIKELETNLKKRSNKVNQLERLLIEMARKYIHENPAILYSHQSHWKKWLYDIAENQDSLQLAKKISTANTLLDELTLLDDDIEQIKDQNQSSENYIPNNTAFVTFNTARSAHICSQIVTSSNPGIFQTRLAPEPRDLLWRGLLRRGRKDKIVGGLRYWAVSVAVWSLTIFWLFPITFILGLTSIQSLSQHLLFLKPFLASSVLIRTFIQNILPTLLVTLFMSLLPWILLVISKQQDFFSYSELEDMVLARYYYFAIFNVLIVFLLGTTFLTTMLDVIYEPTMFIQLLANSLPQGANFFLNYILFNCSTHAMELIQLGSQLFGHLWLTLAFNSRTPRLRMENTTPWAFPFYYYYPNHILIFVIALTYSVIQPLVLIFAVLYYALALGVYRHQHLYCYIKRYETGGTRHYTRVARYTSDGLLIFQFTMVGLLYLKDVLPAATAILPLIVFTIWTKIKLYRLFQCKSKNPSICLYTEGEDTLPKIKMYDDARGTLWTHIDDIWKFSYLRGWWASGRYAHHDNPATLSHQNRLSSLEESETTAVQFEYDENEEKYARENEARLETSLNSMASDRREVELNLDDLMAAADVRLNLLRSQTEAANAECEEYEARIKQHEQEHTSKDHEILSLQIRSKNLEDRLDKTEAQLRTISASYNDADDKAEQAERKVQQLENELIQKEQHYEDLLEKYNSAKADLDELARQFDEL
ncbi:hypothetical protein BDB01DRAFT_760506 [Pilobolus umbonatus]|nr:hypothetical protein BDB01DRAFT_760506 [Pilobolus umbonatus]